MIRTWIWNSHLCKWTLHWFRPEVWAAIPKAKIAAVLACSGAAATLPPLEHWGPVQPVASKAKPPALANGYAPPLSVAGSPLPVNVRGAPVNVPEPSGLLVLATGAVVLVRLARRGQRPGHGDTVQETVEPVASA